MQSLTEQFKMNQGILCSTSSGSFDDGLPLANVTIAGVYSCPTSFRLEVAGQSQDSSSATQRCSGSTLHITGLESATSQGAWKDDLKIALDWA
jgi:alpha-glucosidase